MASVMPTMLILGGNGWLGSLIAEHALSSGWEVTCLARGRRGPTPAGARLVRGDRSAVEGYDDVSGHSWDSVVDVTWQPGFARSAVAALAGRVGHWTYVSSCAVYADHCAAAGPQAVTVQPMVADTADDVHYGPAKAACEQAVRDGLGTRAAILRSGLLVGPGDVSDRFGYWVARMAAHPGGPVLVPPPGARPVQYLDVRDLASWIVGLATTQYSGTVDAVGDTVDLAEIIERSAAASCFAGRRVQADLDVLAAHDISPWFGPRSLPLWLPAGFDPGFAPGDPTAARAGGLSMRPLDGILADTLADERVRGLDRTRRAGLDRALELEVIDALPGSADDTGPQATL